MQSVTCYGTCFHSMFIIQPLPRLFHHPTVFFSTLRGCIVRLSLPASVTCTFTSFMAQVSWSACTVQYSFSNWKHILPKRDDKIWQIWAFSPSVLFLFLFFFFGFIVFDSVSQWDILSSGGSVVRVVGDRTQFCFSALLLDDRVVPLPWIYSCQQKHLSPWGIPFLTSYGQKHRRTSGRYTHLHTYTHTHSASMFVWNLCTRIE